VKRFRRSAPETPEVISSMLAIVHEPNHYETCCRAFSEVREDHSFGVCAPAPLGNTISSLLSRTPLIPLRGTANRLFSCLRAGLMRFLMYREDLRGVLYIRIR
jgi:hypothetical protein